MLERMKKKLLDQRRALFRSVAQLEDDLLWLETDVEPEAEERAQDETMIRLLSQLDDREKAEIEEIDDALRRIAMETYGRCQVCGGQIPAARLEALPTARTCISCAEAQSNPQS
jgi:RNA polymerase-binding protein DksA